MDQASLHAQLTRCIDHVDLSEFGSVYHGKVRETCTTPDGYYILVASDRISAFDFILRQQIPFKGQVLNQIAAYFFEETGSLIPNHVISVPDPNVTIGVHCAMFPIEFVVRGYLVGHAWRTYRAGHRTLCGEALNEGLNQNDRLPTPILTPSTKAEEGHDMDISRQEIIDQGIIDEATFDQLKDMSLTLFNRGTEMAAERGLILVDTKYEFGRRPDGTLVVVDEVHTPDSSRYFYSDTYQERLSKGESQRQLSKEFVREWLMDHHFQGKPGQALPDLPDDFRIEVATRYIELFELITGRAFRPDTNPDPQSRILAAIRNVRKPTVE